MVARQGLSFLQGRRALPLCAGARIPHASLALDPSGHARRALDDARLPRVLRAQPLRPRLDSDPREVKPIGIPARKNRQFAQHMAIAMQAHGFAQVFELARGKLCQDALTPQLRRAIGRAAAMQRIVMVVPALAVVQVREPRKDRRIDL